MSTNTNNMANKYSNATLLLILFFIIGCAQVQEEAPAEETEEEFVDTGVLVIESSPSDAEAYVDNELKGNTPLTLYNFPVGTYKVTIKKQGYFIFEKTVNVAVGRAEEIDAELKQIKPVDVITTDKTEAVEELPETALPSAQQNRINLSTFAMYYDVDKKIFTELRTDGSDLFSRNYNAYLDFVAMAPSRIRLLEKPLKDVAQADCLAANEGVAKLYSGQTLCVISGEGAVFALSGTWTTSPSELEIVSFG